MARTASIELENAWLTFWVTQRGPARLRDWVARTVFGDRQRVIEIEALRDISLTLGEGDRVGIIGHNGAGKSTLLKVLADIYPPTRGTRRVVGRVSSLFDFVLGFELDANGWENIAYRGYLQGESRASVRKKLKAVAEFSELGRYLDVPVRYYSAGMRVRLGFAISTAIEPDILLIDEAFNAGDLTFRDKACERIREIMHKARIVVATSHEHAILSDLCDRVIWMEKGQIREIGRAAETIERYRAETLSCVRAAA